MEKKGSKKQYRSKHLRFILSSMWKKLYTRHPSGPTSSAVHVYERRRRHSAASLSSPIHTVSRADSLKTMSAISRAMYRLQGSLLPGIMGVRGIVPPSRNLTRNLVVMCSNAGHGRRSQLQSSTLCSCGCGIHGMHTRGGCEGSVGTRGAWESLGGSLDEVATPDINVWRGIMRCFKTYL